MLRTAIYCRVSTEDQKIHGLSIETQKKSLEEYARSESMEIVDFYIDEGISARKKYTHRKEFTRLIEDVKQKKIDIIIFTKLDRWFRNISEYYKVQEILEENNVNWKTIFENYDTLTASGRLHVNIMLSVAQDEADRTSERIKSVFKHKLRNGEFLNGSAPYGYDIVNKRLVVNIEKAERVKQIFDMYELKRSICATHRWYLEEFNEKVSYEFISRMLKREVYIGRYKDHASFCEPIITAEQFNRINKEERIPFSHLGTTGLVYVFSGLVYCDTCKRIMNGIVCYNPKPTKYYGCRHGMHHTTCTHNKRCRELKLENKVLEELKQYVNTKVTSISIEKQKPKRSEKDSVNKKLRKLKELYVADLIQIEEYRKDYDSYMKQLDEIERVESKEDTTQNIAAISKFVENASYVELYNKLNDENKRLFWHKVIDKIYVADQGDIRIIFK